MTAPDFDGARNAIALASVESARLWLELFDLVGALERSPPQEARHYTAGRVGRNVAWPRPGRIRDGVARRF